MNIQELHKRILYPVVRVRTQKAGGSGTIIYSKPDKQGKYENFVMTCAHVVDSAISTKKDWDSVLKKKIEKEFLQEVNIEVFDYVYLSTVDSSKSYRANILAYDKHHDIAILSVDTPKPFPYVVELIPFEEIKQIRLFTPIYTAGCSLLHDPFATTGQITYMKELIENRTYYMTSGNAIFGNSGGAVYLADTGQQIGITARITGMPSDLFGFGISFDWMTWMSFMVSPDRIYQFFNEQELKFLYDPSDTFESAMKRREKKQKEALMARRMEEGEPEDKEEY